MPALAPVTIDPADTPGDSVFLFATRPDGGQRMVAEIPSDDLTAAERDGYAKLFATAGLLRSLRIRAADQLAYIIAARNGDAFLLKAFVSELRKAVAQADGC